MINARPVSNGQDFPSSEAICPPPTKAKARLSKHLCILIGVSVSKYFLQYKGKTVKNLRSIFLRGGKICLIESF